MLMIILKTHKIALSPNLVQLKMFGRHAGYARLAYNTALEDFKTGLDNGERRTAYELNKRFNQVKKEKFEWCTELNQIVADRAITKNLGNAIKSFGDSRKRAKTGKQGRFFGFPKFKKRGVHDAFLPRGNINYPSFTSLTVTSESPKSAMSTYSAGDVALSGIHALGTHADEGVTVGPH